MDLLSLDGRLAVRCCNTTEPHKEVKRFLRLGRWAYKACISGCYVFVRVVLCHSFIIFDNFRGQTLPKSVHWSPASLQACNATVTCAPPAQGHELHAGDKQRPACDQEVEGMAREIGRSVMRYHQQGGPKAGWWGRTMIPLLLTCSSIGRMIIWIISSAIALENGNAFAYNGL